MKKKIGSWLQLVVLLFGVFLPALASYQTAEAKSIPNIITSMSVTDVSGNPIPAGFNMWEQFRLNAEFALPDNTVQAGDTTVIQIPNEITFAGNVSFELRDTDSGGLVATAQVNSDTKTVTLTYTNFVENKSGVKGRFFFYGRVDHSVVKSERDIDLNILIEGTPVYAGRVHYNGPPGQYPSQMEKSGWQEGSDPRLLQYELAINRDMTTFQNVVISDSLRSPGLEIVEGSFNILKLDWAWDSGDWKHSNYEDVTAQTNVQLSQDKRNFTIELGNLSNRGALISYLVRVPYDPVDGETFLNDAVLRADGGFSVNDTGRIDYLLAGGSAEGYVFSIDLTKTDENGQPLQGAVFEVTRDRNGVVVDTITTGTDGKAVFTNLLKDNYTIREVTAPQGYKPLANTIAVTPDDFGTTKVASLTIKNEKEDQPKQISISKINLGGEEIAGAKIVIRDDQGAEVASWTSEAGKSKELNLKPGKYVFHEEAAPNGYVAVTDITFQVNYDGSVTVLDTNSNAVEYKDGKLVITDQYDETPKKVIFRKTNAEGKEIAGATIQIFKGTDLTAAPVAEWTTVENQPHEIQLAPGDYTFHEVSAPAGFHAVADFTFRVNYDGTSEVLDANGNNAYIDNGGCTIVAVDPYDETPKKVTFSKVNLGGEEIAGAAIQIFDEQQNKVEEWTSEAGKSKELNLKPGKYVFHEEAAPNGYVAVTDITFQVNYDGSVTVLDTNSNAVEYKNGKLVVTDQYAPTTTTTTTETTTVETTTESTTTETTTEETTTEATTTTTSEEATTSEGETTTTTESTTTEEPTTTTSEVTTTEESTTTTSEETTTTTEEPTTTTSEATTEESTTTTTTTTEEPSVPSTTTEEPPAKPKRVLPSTGDSSTIWTILLGLGILLVSGFGFYFHKKRA